MDRALGRVGLIATGLIGWRAASVLWEGGSTPTQAHATVLMLLATLSGFALLLAAVVGQRPERMAGWLIPPALLVVTLCHVQNHVVQQLENGPLTTDVHIYMDHAARLLREGLNPYSEDLLEAYRVHRMQFTFSTPLIDADVTGRVAYPALSILLFVPIQALGLSTKWVYFVCLLAVLAALFWKAPPRWRPLVLLPFFVDSRFLLYTLGGVSDVVWAGLLCLMVLQWRSRWARALWFGLAAAFKHQPWVLAPFLLVRLWHETQGDRRTRGRAMAEFAGLSAAVFLAVNAPFMVWAPADWLAGVFEPLRAPMITFGQGLSALTMSAILSLPRWLYSVTMLSVLGGSLVLCSCYYRRARYAIWLAPAVALWFGHRSLSSYWYFFLLPLVADLIVPQAAKLREARATTISLKPLVSVVVLWAALALVAVAIGFGAKSPLEVQVLSPLRTELQQVTSMEVAITNRSDRAVEPRIAVQATGLQPYFWIIESGPARLEPGQTEAYQIRAGAHYERFAIRRGARVIVTAADGSIVPVGALVAGAVEDAYRDAIPNSSFFYWVARADHPTYWGLVAAPSDAGRVWSVVPTGEGAPANSVRFELGGRSTLAGRRYLMLDTYLTLPRGPVQLWTRVPAEANRLPELAVIYGLRLATGRHELWVLFGDEDGAGELASGVPYRMVAAPRQAWSEHRLDLRQLLLAAGAPLLPLYSSRPGSIDVGYPIVAANLQLLLWAHGPGPPVVADFGPIRAPRLRPDEASIMAESMRRPEIAELWRGDLALTYRNLDKAKIHYQRARQLLPTEPLVPMRLAEADFWAERWELALASYQTALELDPKNAFAYKGAGWCHYNLDRLTEAEEAWRTALRILERRHSPPEPADLADTLKGLGLAHLRQGRCADGHNYLERAEIALPGVDVPWDALPECEVPPLPKR